MTFQWELKLQSHSHISCYQSCRTHGSDSNFPIGSCFLLSLALLEALVNVSLAIYVIGKFWVSRLCCSTVNFTATPCYSLMEKIASAWAEAFGRHRAGNDGFCLGFMETRCFETKPDVWEKLWPNPRFIPKPFKFIGSRFQRYIINYDMIWMKVMNMIAVSRVSPSFDATQAGIMQSV